MRLAGLFVVPAALLLWSGAAGAADLSKVDRTIKKEPVYQSKPKYCLLVFGPKADTRVWLVLDLAYDPLKGKPGKTALRRRRCEKSGREDRV